MNAISEQLGAYTPLIINVSKAIIFLVLGFFCLRHGGEFHPHAHCESSTH